MTLYKEGKPVSSITLSLNHHIARIDDVSTVVECQGHGYAPRLMRHVLLEAKKWGAHFCFLEASQAGFRLYQKMGFEILFKNNIYFQET